MGNAATSGATSSPPPAGSLRVLSGDVDWTDHGDGFPYKELMHDPATGMRTQLMKMEPGAHVGPHAHAALEQVYVLEGGFDDGEHSYRAGDFVVRAPGAMHSAASPEGALILVVYTPLPGMGNDGDRPAAGR